MATEETNILKRIQLELSPHQVVLFKNTRGKFYPISAVKKLMSAALSLNLGKINAVIKELRYNIVSAGLTPDGSSDLIGYTQVIITSEMVGKKVAIFTAIEVKTATGTAQKNQNRYISVVNSHGGRAGIARNAQEAKKIAQIA